jgi:hypothetical protein
VGRCRPLGCRGTSGRRRGTCAPPRGAQCSARAWRGRGRGRAASRNHRSSSISCRNKTAAGERPSAKEKSVILGRGCGPARGAGRGARGAPGRARAQHAVAHPVARAVGGPTALLPAGAAPEQLVAARHREVARRLVAPPVPERVQVCRAPPAPQSAPAGAARTGPAGARGEGWVTQGQRACRKVPFEPLSRQ